jgi:hypothetical protein
VLCGYLNFNVMVKDKKVDDSDFGLPNIDAKVAMRRKGKWRTVILLLLFLLVGGAVGGYWWYFNKRGSEKVDLVKNLEGVVNEFQKDEVAPVVKEPEVKREGSINIVKAPKGVYYVVCNSFIDSDLALDYAKVMKRRGVDVYIIEPNETRKMGYYYVCEGASGSVAEVNKSIESLAGSYNRSDLWFLKY